MKKGLLIIAAVGVSLAVMMMPMLLEDRTEEIPERPAVAAPAIDDSLLRISKGLQGVLHMEAARNRISPPLPGPQDTVGSSSALRDSLRILADRIQRLSETVQAETTRASNGTAAPPSSENDGTWSDKLSLYVLILFGVLVREVYKLSDGNLRSVTIQEAVSLLDIKTFGGALVLSAALFVFFGSSEGPNPQTYSGAFMTGLAWNTVLEMVLSDSGSSVAGDDS